MKIINLLTAIFTSAPYIYKLFKKIAKFINKAIEAYEEQKYEKEKAEALAKAKDDDDTSGIEKLLGKRK